MFVVMVLMFSSLIFAFEREGPEASYWSFYDCIWWGLMTLTTVGYHLQVNTHQVSPHDILPCLVSQVPLLGSLSVVCVLSVGSSY